MGCDIHIIAEVKDDKGNWVANTDKVFKNFSYDPKYLQEKKEEMKAILDSGEITQEQFDESMERYTEWWGLEYTEEPSSSRNYDWFAVLANVRNGRGFAGIRTGAGFDVIAEPKGLPTKGFESIHPDFEKGTETVVDEDGDEYTPYVFSNIDEEDIDCSPEWIETVKRWSVDMHSHSWLTVEDFDNFDWNQVTMKSGVITLGKYKKLRGTNDSPDTWSGSISGPDIITVDEETADKVLSKKLMELTREPRTTFFGDVQGEPETRPVEDWKIHVYYNWTVLYSEWFKTSIEETVEPLRKLKEKYGDARIIFGFDN